MTDLNKEREAFERFHAKECNCSYEDLKRQLDRQEALTGHRYLPTSPRHEAWLIWDAAWNDASDQAVPEGYVLVPKDVAERAIRHISVAVCHPNNTRIEENIMIDDQESICRAIKASESGAEG
ncbi:hypothetical protein ACQP6V_17315 [Acinetobacter baumannii]|uniref:hypothetical protein n=1 Tax=Acinetobacter baumannii TaxID=470 RepID=UPI003CFF44AA